MSLLENAMRVSSAGEFLRKAASGGIKYTATAGATDILYFGTVPVATQDGNIHEDLKALAVKVHGINLITQSGSGYKAQVCMKGYTRVDEAGNMLNDSTCPFCDAVSPSWDAYNYLKEVEGKRCGLSGSKLEEHLKEYGQSISDERRVSKADTVMYALVAKIAFANGKYILGDDGLPEFDLKIIKITENRLNRYKLAADNAMVPFEGCEIRLTYGNQKSVRDLVGQASYAATAKGYRAVDQYPDLYEKIRKAMVAFDWNGIEQEFEEFIPMSVKDAAALTSSLLERWNRFLDEREMNPNAQYLAHKYVQKDAVGMNQAIGTATAVPGLPGQTTAQMQGQLPGQMHGQQMQNQYQQAQPQVQTLPGQATAFAGVTSAQNQYQQAQPTNPVQPQVQNQAPNAPGANYQEATGQVNQAMNQATSNQPQAPQAQTAPQGTPQGTFVNNPEQTADGMVSKNTPFGKVDVPV